MSLPDVEPSAHARLSYSRPVLFAGIVIPGLVLAAMVAVLYRMEAANERRIHARASTALLDLQREALAAELGSVESDLAFLAGQQALADYLSGDGAMRATLAGQYVLFARVKRRYDQIRYLDAEGLERIRVNYTGGSAGIVPQEELQSKGDRYYVEEAFSLPRGEIFVSRFDLNVEHGAIERPIKPVIRFATPVFDAAGDKRGILVLNYLGSRLLDRMRDLAGTFAGTAMLIDREGNWLIGREPAAEWGHLLGTGRGFAAEYPDAWARMRNEPAGRFETARGLVTFARAGVRPDLYLVTLVPHAVLDRAPDRLLARLAVVAGTLFVSIALLALLLSRNAAARRRQEEQIRDSETRLRALTLELWNAQELERRRISRDLHDDLGQILTAVSLDLKRARQLPDDPRRLPVLDRAIEGTDRLLDRVREISTRLRPTALDDLGLRDAVQSLIADFESERGVPVVGRIDPAVDRAPPDIRQNIYRMLQEALTNVARHAAAGEVRVDLRIDRDGLRLVVEDDGHGFAPESNASEGLGLLGMRERAELFGGSLRVVSEPGGGTRIEAIVTLPRENGGAS